MGKFYLAEMTGYAIMKNVLKETLVREGLSQAELSRVASLSVGTINKICQGKYLASERSKNRIVKALNQLVKEEKYIVTDIFLSWSKRDDGNEHKER